MGLVLDASLAIATLLPEERSAEAAAILARAAQEACVVPALWWLEIVNVSLQAERRGKITAGQRRVWLDRVTLLGIATAHAAAARAWPAISELAARHRLSAHDAAYLDLAIGRRFALGSLDAALRRAATAEAIQVVPA